MSGVGAAALAAHGVDDLVASVARAHAVADVGASADATGELLARLADRGWSRRNAERLLGLAVELPPAPPTARRAPSAPPPKTEPVHLVVLPVESITGARDMFRCEPYAAHVSAGTCMARQHAELTPRRVRWQHNGAARVRFPRCADCELGRRVAALVEGRA